MDIANMTGRCCFKTLGSPQAQDMSRCTQRPRAPRLEVLQQTCCSADLRLCLAMYFRGTGGGSSAPCDIGDGTTNVCGYSKLDG